MAIKYNGCRVIYLFMDVPIVLIIGEEFNLNNYSSVSTAIERIKRKLEGNKFKKRYERIVNSL